MPKKGNAGDRKELLEMHERKERWTREKAVEIQGARRKPARLDHGK